MGLVEGFLLFILAFGGGAAVGQLAKKQPVDPVKSPLTSEGLECRAICGRDRVQSFDRLTGECTCISTRN